MGIRYRMLNGKPVILEDTNTGYVRPKDSNTHTHEEETPNFEKMTKKALGDWAKENDISVDSKKTKAKMIEEIKKQL